MQPPSPTRARRRTRLVALTAAAAAAAASAVLAAPSARAANLTLPAHRDLPSVTSPSAYSGLADGSVLYANGLNVPGVDVAKASTGQSAAGVHVPAPLTTAGTTDQLQQPLLELTKTGKTAFGHGSGANVGLLQAANAPGQIQQTLAEATSPKPSSASGSALDLTQLEPLLRANVLSSTAAANTTSDNSCVLAPKAISSGEAQVANADALETSPTTPVVALGGTSQSTSDTRLVTPMNAAGKPVSTGNAALGAETVANLAPVTLFKGTPAELTIKVLAPLRLAVSAGGVAGTATVSYAPVGRGPQAPIVSITAGGQTQTLSSQDLFGNGGLKIALGVADVTIGTPPHALTGLENTVPKLAADGTSASAAVDFIRVTVPGSLPSSATGSGDPLGQVLNPVLQPIVAGLSQVTDPIGQALKQAGVTVADVRVGHLEASVAVPAGGIVCPAPPNPLGESVKDVSTLAVAPGQTFTYDIRVPNRGSQDVTNVTVTDTYSNGLQFVSSVPAPDSHSGNVLTYKLGTLAPNQFDTIVLTFRVPADASAGTVYHNHADITGTYAGQPVSQTVDVSGPTVAAAGAGGCALTYSTKYASNTQVTTGENFGYFVNVLNSGGSPCTGVQVTDTLINGVTFVSCTASCTHSGQDVSWQLGTLAPGQSTVVSVVVKVTATSGTLPDTAHVTSTNGGAANPQTPGPTVSGTSVPAPGVPAGCRSNCPTSVLGETLTRGTGPLAFTGLSSAIPGLGALLVLVGGLGLARRRRS